MSKWTDEEAAQAFEAAGGYISRDAGDFVAIGRALLDAREQVATLTNQRVVLAAELRARRTYDDAPSATNAAHIAAARVGVDALFKDGL